MNVKASRCNSCYLKPLLALNPHHSSQKYRKPIFHLEISKPLLLMLIISFGLIHSRLCYLILITLIYLILIICDIPTLCQFIGVLGVI